MKILCVSDERSPQLENAANLRLRYSDIDLVISCGDLSSAYLDFIVTVLGLPLLYVRGNHDEQYDQEPPGGIDLHGRVVNFKGFTFAGLEGCIQYNQGMIQYTQTEMYANVIKFAPRMYWQRLRKGWGVDVFVAHSPPRGIHDIEDDYPHRGFDAFIRLMEWYRPRYMVHGHVHTWDRRKQTETLYEKTQVINIMPYTILELTETKKS